MSMPHSKDLLGYAGEALPKDWCHCPIGLVCADLDASFVWGYARCGSLTNEEIDEQAALLMGWSEAQICTFRETFDEQCPDPNRDDGFTEQAVAGAIRAALVAAEEAP